MKPLIYEDPWSQILWAGWFYIVSDALISHSWRHKQISFRETMGEKVRSRMADMERYGDMVEFLCAWEAELCTDCGSFRRSCWVGSIRLAGIVWTSFKHYNCSKFWGRIWNQILRRLVSAHGKYLMNSFSLSLRALYTI
ncbi:hypothetical protein BDZ97DRAFT_1165675 [Flammula alnicola]|nr:hypothetical protein BDZ97DRAFT_1165675 [Flammula alnicola]